MDINGEPQCLPITVRRDGADAVGYIYRTIGMVDTALASVLHQSEAASPWSVQTDGDLTRIVVFDGRVAEALAVGVQHRGDLVSLGEPVTAQSLIDRGDEGPDAVLTTLAPVRTSASARASKGLADRPDALFPDPARILNDLDTKWVNLGWPKQPGPKGGQINGALLRYSIAHLNAGRLKIRGWSGILHLDMRLMAPEDRAVIWTLLRFGELRNVGRNVSYGMGAFRVEARPYGRQ